MQYHDRLNCFLIQPCYLKPVVLHMLIDGCHTCALSRLVVNRLIRVLLLALLLFTAKYNMLMQYVFATCLLHASDANTAI